jgi:U3-containing 90S pre-ribosomal complex subunit
MAEIDIEGNIAFDDEGVIKSKALKKRKRMQEFDDKLAMRDEKLIIDKHKQVDYFWKCYSGCRKFKDLTSLELGEMPPESAILEAKETLLDSIKALFPNWKRLTNYKEASKLVKPGNPKLLILSISATRCTEVLKQLNSLNARIAKLFAKHLSVDEQKEILKQSIAFAVGTPARVMQLIQLGCLNLDGTVVMIDLTPDSKKFNILTSFDASEDFFTLYRECLHEKLRDGKVKFSFFT